jgi:hypothetical protein
MLLAAGNATGATILSLDDPAVDTDQGAEVQASFVSTSFDSGPATGWSTLRRLNQDVTLDGTATIVQTPIGDGSEYTGQAHTSSLSATAGGQQVIESPTMVPGTRFQHKVAVTAHTGTVELGEADQWFVQRRSTRR